jgi:hypothetical protein
MIFFGAALIQLFAKFMSTPLHRSGKKIKKSQKSQKSCIRPQRLLRLPFDFPALYRAPYDPIAVFLAPKDVFSGVGDIINNM